MYSDPWFFPIFVEFFKKFCYSQKFLGPFRVPTPFSLSPLEPCSTCAVEFDAYVTDIVNPRVNLENNGGWHLLNFIIEKRKFFIFLKIPKTAFLAQFESVGLNFIWEEERRRCELLGLDGPSAPTTADDEPREEPEHGRSHDYSAAERKQRKKEFGRVLIQLERLESAGTAAADTARTSSAVEQSLLCSQQTARSSSKLVSGEFSTIFPILLFCFGSSHLGAGHLGTIRSSFENPKNFSVF